MSTKKSSKSGAKKPATKKKTSSPAGSRNKAKTKSSTASDRSQQRVPINLLVDYCASGSYLFDFCKNLGTGGVFIETSTPLPRGSSIDLTFTIPDSKETVDTKGEVIWVQDEVTGRDDLTPGMGVQFSGFDDEQRRLLEDFISRYSTPRNVTTLDKNSGKKPA